MTDKVKEFWDEQARLHGGSDQATAPDHYYRELEIGKIIEHLDPGDHGESVLDVGCGNGYSTFRLAAHCQFTRFVGVDFSPEMINQAEKRDDTLSMALEFYVGDVRDLSFLGEQFDTIVSERCIINLTTWVEQKVALLAMHERLKRGGKLILVENTINGLDRLNEIRRSVGLHDIKTRWHNRYLEESEFNEFIRGHFTVTHQENIGNFYYLASRVIHAKLSQMEGIDPAYNHPINKIAAQLPTLGIHNALSPNFLWVLHKK